MEKQTLHNAHIVNKGQFGSLNRLAVEKGTVGGSAADKSSSWPFIGFAC